MSNKHDKEVEASREEGKADGQKGQYKSPSFVGLAGQQLISGTSEAQRAYDEGYAEGKRGKK